MMEKNERLDVHCEKCRKETSHLIRMHQNTPANVVVIARCASCGNTITLPLSGTSRAGTPASFSVKRAIAHTKRRRKIIKRDG
jgi:ribosomal protein S27E